MRPQIQNDFATYRRYLSRLKREQEAGMLSELPVVDTDANAISMFIAEVRESNSILMTWPYLSSLHPAVDMTCLNVFLWYFVFDLFAPSMV